MPFVENPDSIADVNNPGTPPEPILIARLPRDGAGFSFTINQRAFPHQTPPVSAQFACSANHAMAWYHDGDRVGRTRTSDGSGRSGSSDSGSHFTIGLDLAIRNRLQVAPHPHLKRRCAN